MKKTAHVETLAKYYWTAHDGAWFKVGYAN